MNSNACQENARSTIQVTRHDLNNQIMKVIAHTESLKRSMERSDEFDPAVVEVLSKILNSAFAAAECSCALFPND